MAFRQVEGGGLVGYQSSVLCDAGFSAHLFTTRCSGKGVGRHDELNLGFSCGDAESVRENFRRLCNAFHISYRNLVLAKQTHCDIIYHVTPSDAGNGVCRENRFESVDAMVTDVPDLPLAVFFADCVPILLADCKTGAVAACHSGWRGTALKIAFKTVERMRAEFGSRAQDLVAAIGPCLCQKHFETSPEVFAQLITPDTQPYARKVGEKYEIDLKAINRHLLLRAGLQSDRIDVSDLCTVCQNDQFFSHRAEHGDTGRLCALIEARVV